MLHAPSSTPPANHTLIYQFIPVAPVRVMERLIRSMGAGTMAVLDLEDGYLDVRDLVKTMKSKDHRILDPALMVCLPPVLL